VQEVNRLLKQFEESKRMMRMMADKSLMAKMTRNMPKR
jgi:signal recognition particle GTPase